MALPLISYKVDADGYVIIDNRDAKETKSVTNYLETVNDNAITQHHRYSLLEHRSIWRNKVF